MKDQQIIDLFWERDPAAIEETQKAYGKGLQSLAMRILRDEQEAEECVSDTYLKAWQTIPPQRPTFFFAYLAKICRFAAFGRLDRQNTDKRSAVITELTAELQQVIPDRAANDPAEQAAAGDMLDRFLAGLPKRDRVIFLRRYWYGDSFAEIAARVGLSQGAVRTRLFRIRQKLKSYLEKEGYTL